LELLLREVVLLLALIRLWDVVRVLLRGHLLLRLHTGLVRGSNLLLLLLLPLSPLLLQTLALVCLNLAVPFLCGLVSLAALHIFVLDGVDGSDSELQLGENAKALRL
jgi:hypothetical protein